jgi:hypothetical protein
MSDKPTPSEMLQAELEPIPQPPMTLGDEIEEARARLAALEHRALSATCAELGHKWKSTGGANCGCEGGSCSVPVNTCERCGDCDYGDNDEARDVIARCHL